MDPMLKSVCEEVHAKAGDRIRKVCTKFREPFNYTQYLFPDYALLTGRGALGLYSFKYVEMNDLQYVSQTLKDGNAKIICVNDSKRAVGYGGEGNQIENAFNEKFPDRSGFEHEKTF